MRSLTAAYAGPRERLVVRVRGAVQGVGFRPFVYRLALDMDLPGWVNNSPQGVNIEVEGNREELRDFLSRLQRERPPRSAIQQVESAFLPVTGYTTFEIRPSLAEGAKSALVLPDLAACADCLGEIFDPLDRRYRYPFTNCTNCGPRFSIIEALPYDRANTTMKAFVMCERCRAEYEDPLDRRFHAQPNACPQCGPQLALWSRGGEIQAMHDSALQAAARAIRSGLIIAVKGLGGFQLVCDARNEGVVHTLRDRKHRDEKPFALMYPTLSQIEEHCLVSDLETELLTSPESPIVLLKRRDGSKPPTSSLDERNASYRPSSTHEIAPNVAPGNPYLGVMLPYTPLHHLLLADLGFPIVATSGNLSDEPICTDKDEALRRLARIADLFLVHDRPIARHVDDSVVRVLAGREMVMRRARGYAPLPIHLTRKPMRPTLAVGAHLKSAVALSVGQDAFVSQHIGDLETTQSLEAFRRVIADFQRLYDTHPEVVACDNHPDYLSTKYARETGLPLAMVQHHVAHVYSCIAENGLARPVLGVSWDGTGYGTDGTVWGGEFLRVGGGGKGERGAWTRVAHFRTFLLPGGEQAVKEPRRSAVGALHELLGEQAWPNGYTQLLGCSGHELAVWRAMLHQGLNSPRTSSVGRLFDAVAAILGVQHKSSFEGQAAMELESSLRGVETDERYGFDIVEPPDRVSPAIIDWFPTLLGVLSDRDLGVPVSQISARFHNTLVEIILAVAHRAGDRQVALTGGCFQNAYLAERAIGRLREDGFRPYWHRLVPPNDGGIALGQLFANSEC